LLLVVWNVPGMLDSGADLSIRHLSRHQHAFDVALGLVFLFVAWRPDRAYGTVPVAATFTIALAGAALFDLINGASTVEREAPHLVELIGLGLVWALGMSAGPGRRRKPEG
jgi:predicted anti-sigma-YlaC factor YlaD